MILERRASAQAIGGKVVIVKQLWNEWDCEPIIGLCVLFGVPIGLAVLDWLVRPLAT